MDGRTIYAAQAVAANKEIIVRLLGFDPTTGAVRLAIDELCANVGAYRVTAIFGSGNSAYADYDGQDPNKDNHPILKASKQYDTLKEITAGPVPPPRPKESIFRPEKACAEYKQLEGQWKSAQQEWMYFVSPNTKDIRGTSARKSKEMARDAQAKMRQARQSMDWHKQACAACEAAFEEIQL